MAKMTKAASAAKNEIVQAKSNLPTAAEEAAAFAGIAGDGFEHVTARDIILPRLTILQGLSPQVTKGTAEYDETARVGNIYDIGFKEDLGEQVQIIPVAYKRAWLEWAPRNSGRGLQRIHENEDILSRTKPDERNKPILPNGNYVSETAQLYALLRLKGGSFRQVFIPMASTQLKKARQLISFSNNERWKRDDGTEYRPPLFSRTYFLGVAPEKNAEGIWNGWKVDRGPKVSELPNWKMLLPEISDFRNSLEKGEVRGDMSAVEQEDGDSGSGGTGQSDNARM